MSYFAPYIDEYGPHVPSYNDILEYLVGDPDNIESNPGIFRQIYGMDIYLENDSPDYQFLSALALLYYDCCQSFLYAYNNQNPTTAVGLNLDRLVSINGIVRKSASYSLATLNLTGAPNTSVSYIQAKDVNGNIWQIDRNVTFDSSGNATVIASCLTPGRIQASSNTITIMATPVQNWYSVTNPSAAIPGSNAEPDSVLRERQRQSIGLSAQASFDSLIASIKSLNVVRRATVYENDTASTVDSIPAHSIAVVVESDDSTETKEAIAEAIYKKKAPGVGTYGDISVDIETSTGLTNTINFSHPTEVTATVAVSLTALSGYTSDLEDEIVSSIVDYINGLGIGENLYVSNLFLPILENNGDTPYFYINSITVNSQTSIVSVSKFSVLTTSAEDITITVS